MTFWNVHKKVSLVPAIVQLVRETRCDILVTAETGRVHKGLDTVLRTAVDPIFRHLTPLGRSIHVWTTLNENQIEQAGTGQRFEAFRVRTFASEQTLMVFAHLKSKVNRSAADEMADTMEFAVAVRAMEKEKWSVGRTAVVGDLNLNPYDEAMLTQRGLAANAARAIVTGQPKVQRNRVGYDRFYNPTWNLLGDIVEPPGTYFWKGDGFGGNWYCLDQVLLRAALIPMFLPASLRVVTSIGGAPLVWPNGQPAPYMSDHLPIAFALET